MMSPFQQKAVERAAKEPDFALQMLYQHKWSKLGDFCSADGIVFNHYCLLIKRLGGWEEGLVQTIKKLGQVVARATYQDDSEVI